MLPDGPHHEVLTLFGKPRIFSPAFTKDPCQHSVNNLFIISLPGIVNVCRVCHPCTQKQCLLVSCLCKATCWCMNAHMRHLSPESMLCATWPAVVGQDRPISIEHWKCATEQACCIRICIPPPPLVDNNSLHFTANGQPASVVMQESETEGCPGYGRSLAKISYS